RGCASRSTPRGCISSTTRPKRRFRPSVANTISRAAAAARTPWEETMTQNHRRRLLQLAGAGAVAAGTGGLAGILASGRAPAYGQATTLHWVRWSDFVPASAALLKRPDPRQ